MSDADWCVTCGSVITDDGCACPFVATPHALTREQEVSRALQRLREDPFRLGAVDIMGMIYDEWTNPSHQALAQQAQELAKVRLDLDVLGRLSQSQAQEVERLKLQRAEAMTECKMYESQHGLLFQENLQLRKALAAMTAERDEAIDETASLRASCHAFDLQVQELQARVRELEGEIVKHRPKSECYDRVCQSLGISRDILGHVATLQATLAEREARIAELEQSAQRITLLGAAVSDEAGWETAKRFEALYDTARQDAARLREAAQNLTCEVCKMDMQRALKEA